VCVRACVCLINFFGGDQAAWDKRCRHQAAAARARAAAAAAKQQAGEPSDEEHGGGGSASLLAELAQVRVRSTPRPAADLTGGWTQSAARLLGGSGNDFVGRASPSAFCPSPSAFSPSPSAFSRVPRGAEDGLGATSGRATAVANSAAGFAFPADGAFSPRSRAQSAPVGAHAATPPARNRKPRGSPASPPLSGGGGGRAGGEGGRLNARAALRVSRPKSMSPAEKPAARKSPPALDRVTAGRVTSGSEVVVRLTGMTTRAPGPGGPRSATAAATSPGINKSRFPAGAKPPRSPEPTVMDVTAVSTARPGPAPAPSPLSPRKSPLLPEARTIAAEFLVIRSPRTVAAPPEQLVNEAQLYANAGTAL